MQPLGVTSLIDLLPKLIRSDYRRLFWHPIPTSMTTSLESRLRYLQLAIP